MCEENIKNFRKRLTSRGYPYNLVDKILSEVKFVERKNTLTQTQKAHKRILPFLTHFHPSLFCLKHILMEKWHLIQNQRLLREIYKDPPLISCRKGKWTLKDMLVKADYKGLYQHNGHTVGVAQVCQPHLTKKTKTVPKSRKNRLYMYANIPRCCWVSAITREKTIKL